LEPRIYLAVEVPFWVDSIIYGFGLELLSTDAENYIGVTFSCSKHTHLKIKIQRSMTGLSLLADFKGIRIQDRFNFVPYIFLQEILGFNCTDPDDPLGFGSAGVTRVNGIRQLNEHFVRQNDPGKGNIINRLK